MKNGLLFDCIAVIYRLVLISKNGKHAFLRVRDELLLYRSTKVCIKRVS